jgi:hypothetical protein
MTLGSWACQGERRGDQRARLYGRGSAATPRCAAAVAVLALPPPGALRHQDPIGTSEP